MSWTEERTARLTELWAEGVSASEIGTELGINKNAVIGKAHRMKLTPRKSSKPPGPHHLRWGPKKPKPVVRLPEQPATQAEPSHETGRPVSLYEAGYYHCRWPITEVTPIESFLYCGNLKAEGTPYCPEHFRRSRGSPIK
jgi:GcrA cell cycle regulator